MVKMSHDKLSGGAEFPSYPRQYAGVYGHNLRQAFHGLCPNSNGTFPKDSQDLLKQNWTYTRNDFLSKTLLTDFFVC